jgi:UDP-2-acetamido-2,6-beta-L-arabino-hexul-4-ose reductase
MKIVVTGGGGFIGKNLLVHLRFRGYSQITIVERSDDRDNVAAKLRHADYVFHLAGVNRPSDPGEFETVNHELTSFLIQTLESFGRPYCFIYASSTQAALANPYGESKAKAERSIETSIQKGTAFIYRLPGVFGKWCKPNYNSVVATFCYQMARDLPVQVSDPAHRLTLVYVDDVVQDFLNRLGETDLPEGQVFRRQIEPVHEIKLEELLVEITKFKESRKNLVLPEIGDPLTKKLYTTWLSYLPEDAFSYGMELKRDDRGWLFELLKTKDAGQIFISKTLPGITRGNHFHHTKTEKFVVIQGDGLIRFRKVIPEGQEIIEYRVSGNKPEVVDIPPGYTHSITNTGSGEMLTLFWANEIFEPERSDTYFVNV